MRNVFTDAMKEVGGEDPNLVVLVGDISHFALQPFAKVSPGRFYNIGILEPTMVSMAAGLSHAGLNPVAHTIAPFLIERSLEQIKLDFCYQGLGGTLVSVGSAFDYSGLGCSHHCYNDMAAVKGLPNTEVIYPASPLEFTRLFKDTYRNKRLTYFRLPGAKHSVEFKEEQVVLGRGIKVKDGADITLIGAGPQLGTVMAALPGLSSRGIEAEVIYLPALKPFDRDIVRKSLEKTRRLLLLEEHSQFGGFGDEVLRATAGLGEFKASFVQIPDEFQRGYGHYKDHLNKLGFTPENVVRLCAQLLGR